MFRWKDCKFSESTDGINSVCGSKSNEVFVFIYDDYNSRLPEDQDSIGALTCNIGNSTLRNGIKLVEITLCSKNDLDFLGGIENKWLEDGKNFSRNYKQGYRVYSADGIACSLSVNGGGLGGSCGLYLDFPRIF